MENNTTNTPENTTEQPPVNQSPNAGEKIAAAAGKAAKAGAKAAGKGMFGIIVANISNIMIALAIAGVAVGLGFGVKAILGAGKIKIMDTATVVTEIKKISEFTTYTYIDELIIHEKKTEAKEVKSGLLDFVKKESAPDSLRSEIVMIVGGVTRAGYDLGKLTENDLKISGDTISVTLPSPEIFDVIVNPSDNKMFVEEGTWSHEEITAMQVNCRNQMHRNALDRGILNKANEVGKEKVENLFKALGFKMVIVITTPVPVVEPVVPETPVQEEPAPVEETAPEAVQKADTTAIQ
ncbi:MAG: DUF4230 domain-containing protein [Firmicutes bacterium]|nr:DUF4230 domain-containing protein [Bacillota bacterium]